MNHLTVEDYDAAERRALDTTCNRIIECCVPSVFAYEGYPTRIYSTEAAARYVDTMHDRPGRAEDTFSSLIGGLTEEEIDLMARVAGKVAELSQSLYGRRLVPRSGMLRALVVVRHIRYLFPDPSALILEVGPGSGYVGALLLELGYRYAATDITQALYVYQNHLLNALAPGQVLELATDGQDFFDLSRESEFRALHIPWWKFVRPNPAPALTFELVTCNHTLCEMHARALGYTTRLAAQLLAGKGLRCVLFEGFGSTARNPIWHAGQAFSQAGLCFAHNDTQSAVLVRDDSLESEQAMHLPLDPAAEDEAAYHPPIYDNPDSSVGTAVKAGREKTRGEATRGLADLDRVLAEILGHSELRIDDEVFRAFAG